MWKNFYFCFLLKYFGHNIYIQVLERRGAFIDKKNFKLAKTKLIRLIYYNDYLLKEGMLTNLEHQKMNNVIISKYGKN